MANRNRTEVAAAIEALAAIVDLEELKEALNDFFAQSCVFRKDVSSSLTDQTSIDFTDIDYISDDITAIPTGTVNLTISGVQQGEIKYLLIIKNSSKEVTFTGATDIGPGVTFTAESTTILYRLTNKDGSNVLAEPMDNYFETTSWQNPSYNSGFTAGSTPLQYRLYRNKLEFRGDMDSTAGVGAAFTLPTAYRPAAGQVSYFTTSATTPTVFSISSAGVVSSNDWNTLVSNSFNVDVILD